MKSKITFSALVIVLLFSLFIASGSTGAQSDRSFTIAYSNNVEGYLESCG